MIDITQNPQNLPLTVREPARAVLRYREEDTERTAGSMPVWEQRTGRHEQIAGTLESATAENNPAADSSASTLSYAENPTQAAKGSDEFGFADLLDMINPLQHIPLVNHLYRDLTGDTIKPVSRIIGGTIFGGPAGGAVALVNTAVEYETGKDIAGNVLAMAGGRGKPAFRSVSDDPEQRLAAAARSVIEKDVPPSELPGTVLSFADLGGGRKRVAERFHDNDMERTAGTIVRRYTEEPPAPRPTDFLPPREPITTLSFASPSDKTTLP